tara:strand:- start:1848 stop:2285 length:438 start_codon:yes stop_codon:yes gene_type:complete
MPSSSLYETFGNEIKYTISEGTIKAYLENSTIDFPLPEAISDLLAGFVSFDKSLDGQLLDQVEQKLISKGFKKPKAKTMATVLLQVAESEGINPLTYFDDPDVAVKLTQDSYDAINAIRPSGNRLSLTTAINNSKNIRLNGIIQP